MSKTKMGRALRTIACFFACAVSTASLATDKEVSVVGVVVSIRRGPNDTRLRDGQQPDFADLAEIYMVKTHYWESSDIGVKFFILEYVHHDGIIEYDRFDRVAWVFHVRKALSNETADCRFWLHHDPRFVRTAFGKNEKLPDPDKLPCFLTTTPPTPETAEKRTQFSDRPLH